MIAKAKVITHGSTAVGYSAEKELADIVKVNNLPEGITPAAMKYLEAWRWPGNVRELRNTVEKMVVLSSGGKLDVEDVPEQMRATGLAPSISASGTLGETEKAKILATLKEAGGNRTRAAQMLGISRRTIYRKLDEYAAEGEQI